MIKKFNEYIPIYEKIIQKKYKNFPEELLNEGLIKSIEYDKFVELLERLFEKSGKNKLSYDLIQTHMGVNIEVDRGFFSEELFEKLINLLNVSGYIVNYFFLDEEEYNRYPDMKDLFSNYETITINIIKKFDTTNNSPLPEYLYHVSEQKYYDKIMKNGLIPRSLKKIENHPERVYFLDSLEGANNFKEILEDMNPENNYIILRVDIKLLPKLKLHFDPTYFQNEEDYYNEEKYKAYYTYNNITPLSLKLIK